MRKVFDCMVAGFVFLSACFYMSGRNFHEAQRDMFHLLAPVIVLGAWCLKPERSIRNLWIVAFGILAIVNIYTCSVKTLAIEFVVNILLAIGTFFSIANYLKDRDLIYKTLLTVCLVQVGFVVMQFFGLDPLCLNDLAGKNQYLVGMFGHPMNLGIYAALMAPIFAWRLPKMIWVPLIMLFASKSWAAIPLGIFALGTYYFLTKNRKGWVMVLSLIIVAGVLGGVIFARAPQFVLERKLMMRVDLYMDMLSAGLSSGSFFGFGLGTFPQIANSLPVIKSLKHGAIGTILEPWNEYVGWLIEMGPMAPFLMTGMFWGWARCLRRKLSGESAALLCSVLTIPFGILFHSYSYFVNTGVVCLVLIAMFEITKEEACL